MQEYNTKQKELKLPEYGRYIQKMVDHCLTIEDKEKRTACAYAIVDTMSTLFPPEGNPEEYEHKLWDHLSIMSDFKLDIDWPYEVVKADSLSSKPEPLPIYKDQPDSPLYGRTLVSMIQVASDMENGEEKDALVLLIANQMKKVLVLSFPDMTVEDRRVFDDLARLSKGAITLPEDTKLLEYKAMPAPSKKKKKK